MQLVEQKVVKALIVDGSNILFLWDPNIKTTDKWETPGGRIRDGESDIDALIREAKEEAGIAIKVGKLIDEWEFPMPWKSWVLIGKSYLCKPITKEVRLEDPEKQHTEYAWMEIAKAKTLDLTPWLEHSLTKL